MNLQTGAFGDPGQLQTLILFWSKMELLHYPGAGETKAYLETELKRQQEAAMAQMAAQKNARQGPQMETQAAQRPGIAPTTTERQQTPRDFLPV